MELHSFLSEYVKQNKVYSYLEIGTREGDSLSKVISGSDSLSDIYVCDTWSTYYGGSGRNNHNHIDLLVNQLKYQGNITYLNGDSKVKIPELHNTHLGYFDLILVDGDHSAEGGMADLENVIHLSKINGGCILFHDITHPAHLYLEKVFDDFVKKYSDKIITSKKLTEHLGIGIINT